jgi:hydrogenase maturation protein HypF
VRGVVQGVGFRPFIYNTACANRLSGWVQNRSGVVLIEAQGDRAALDGLLCAIRHSHPPQARIEAVEVQSIACQDQQADAPEFHIRASSAEAAPTPAIPADMATCDLCLAEIRNPTERRYRYPFTNCTNCGPRWSIIRQLPYDRPRTSMAQFELCPECAAQYADPADRRFHAQPIACPRCGPTLQLLDAQGHELATSGATAGLSSSARAAAALDMAAQAVLDGRIVAIKGLGGFQLLADAGNADAVALLRQRKRRPDRPFALMFATLDDVRRCCEVSEAEARALASPQAPIILLRRRADWDSPIFVARKLEQSPTLNPQIPKSPNPLSSIAPGNPYLGVLLPYTPLHHLLMDAIGRPVICTSGNLSEEPMVTATEEALQRLGCIADVFLTHDRAIVRPVDDSVARCDAQGLQLLRRARGYAPLPIELACQGPTILAVGGHLKNTVALGLAGRPMQVVVSPHVGDLDSVLSIDVFRRAIDDLLEFFAATAAVVACDLHPDYASTRHAEQLAARGGVPLVRVQHHHAHVAACMAEHRLDGPVLGLSWDGTGYGTDGTVWGGEALVCDGGDFVRAAHLRTFPLPGGDRAVREPRRAALGLLYEIMGDAATDWLHGDADRFSSYELKTLFAALDCSLNAPRTSSMGRLFDAVAALCGLPQVISFEGQAAMALEFAADSHVADAYPFPLSEAMPAIADWEPMLRAVLADRAYGVPIGRIGARFHNALAELAVATAHRAGVPQVVLSGGCFQNALLSDSVRQRLCAAGFSVYTHRLVPPGDGGIALGQVFVAAQQMQRARHVSGNTR